MYRESRVNRSWLPPSYTSTKNRAVLSPGRSHRCVRCLGRNLNIYKLFRGEIVRMAGILIWNETMFDGPTSPSYTSSSAAVVRSDSMGEPKTLDDLDVKILRLLNADARKSYRDIAQATDASISTISSRVRKLEDLGVITGYVPVLNEARLGYDVLAVVGV